ncbi:MAG: UDP-3-O-(3-hydroxymyristoyl)glucosamine N-acyltransferase [Planctomycetaceae bacterium]
MNRIDGLSVTDLVKTLDGVTILGDSAVICTDALPLWDATDGCVTLMDDASRCAEVIRSRAVAVVTSQYHAELPCTQIIATDLHRTFTAIVKRFRHTSSAIVHSSIDATAQIEPTASIGSGTRIDAGVIIGAGVQIGQDCHLMAGVVVLEQTTIGDHCTIYPRVVIYEHTRIDNHVQIHAGCVIGAHGFGYHQVDGRHIAKAQLGYVHIESSVDIGANTTIDRGTYGVTRIGEGTKIDNLVQIAHNCQLGRHNLICSQVGLAGSCRTGDYVILAGQVGIADHITLGDHAVVGAQAGVMEDLAGKQTYLGSPATSQRDQMQILAVQRRLPEMRRELKSLRREIDHLNTQDEVASTFPNDELRQGTLQDAVDADVDHPCCLKFKRPAA